MEYTIIDLAYLQAGADFAKRLQQEMQASMNWKRQQTELEAPCMNLNADKGYDALLSRTIRDVQLSHSRGSSIVKLLPEPRVEARSSQVHGTGVFAIKDIPAFSYLTTYPCDGILVQRKDEGSWDGIGHHGSSYAESLAYRQELPAPHGLYALCIEGNPTLSDDPHFLGHLMNDGAQCKRPEAASVYTAASLQKLNSMFCHVLGAHFSVKDLKAGDEIFNHYGADYWLDLAERTSHLSTMD